MLKKFKKSDLVVVLICLGVILGFYFFQTSQIKASPGKVEFVNDVILDLPGLSTTIFIAKDSKCDNLTISGTELTVNAVDSGSSFLLKTSTQKVVLEITPSGGTADFVFNSANFSSEGYLNRWREKSSATVNHTVGVPIANQDYIVKVDGKEFGQFNSGAGAEINFSRTGKDKWETYTIESPPCQDHNVYGWAWSERIGWISFSCRDTMEKGKGVNYGVDIDRTTGIFSGYAWSRGTKNDTGGIGWIKLNPTTNPPGETSAKPVRVDLTDNGTVCGAKYNVCGWARACAAVADKNTCEGASDPNAGGWDGWIKLRKDSKDSGADYGVYIATSTIPTDPAQFHGWAWAGDDSTSTAVIGWVSFNCSNRGVCNATTTEGGPSNYKVLTTFFVNQPPDKPDIPPNSDGETWNHCGVQGLSIPTFHWTYNDKDKDSQIASQVKIYGETTLETEEFSCPPTCTSYYPPSEWIRNNNLKWGQTYSWQVRVKDSRGAWSEWSDSNSFTMPVHAYPYIHFSHSPQNPPIGETVTFIDKSKCYSSPGNTEYNCKDGNASILYAWDFDYSAPDFTVDNTTKGNATTTFKETKDYWVGLKITDNTLPGPDNYCIRDGDSPVGATLPLPEYIEVPPISWLKNFFASILEFFKDFSRIAG